MGKEYQNTKYSTSTWPEPKKGKPQDFKQKTKKMAQDLIKTYTNNPNIPKHVVGDFVDSYTWTFDSNLSATDIHKWVNTNWFADPEIVSNNPKITFYTSDSAPYAIGKNDTYNTYTIKVESPKDIAFEIPEEFINDNELNVSDFYFKLLKGPYCNESTNAEPEPEPKKAPKINQNPIMWDELSW